MTRRHFPPEYKLEAASKVLDEGLCISDACQTFDVGPTAMRRWVKQLARERTGAVPPSSKPLSIEQRRIHELEARVDKATSLEHAQEVATRSLWTYNHERPNTAIGGITPMQKLAMAV